MNDRHSITADLLSRIDNGDLSAVNALMAQHRDYLRRFVEFQMDPLLRKRVDPSDVVQETQFEVMQRIKDYLKRRPMSFRVWLRKTACQRVGMLRRYHLKARQRSVRREVALPDAFSLSLAKQHSDGRPSKGIEEQERAIQVRSALALLAEPDYEILVMRAFEELTNQEAAEALGIDPTAASKRFGRALMRLKEKLAQVGFNSQS